MGSKIASPSSCFNFVLSIVCNVIIKNLKSNRQKVEKGMAPKWPLMIERLSEAW